MEPTLANLAIYLMFGSCTIIPNYLLVIEISPIVLMKARALGHSNGWIALAGLGLSATSLISLCPTVLFYTSETEGSYKLMCHPYDFNFSDSFEEIMSTSLIRNLWSFNINVTYLLLFMGPTFRCAQSLCCLNVAGPKCKCRSIICYPDLWPVCMRDLSLFFCAK